MTGVATGPDAGRSAIDRYAILDTPAEAGFDDLVVLASQCCAAPIAAVGLFATDRQWFKARIGLAERELPIAESICALAVDAPDLFVIPDLAADPRTVGNLLVARDEGARFYAGMPMRDPAGELLGTLIVLDTVPRPHGLSAREADGMRRLARQVTAQLELRRMIDERDGGVARRGGAHQAPPPMHDVLSISERHWRELFEKLSEGFVVGELIRDADGRTVDWRYLDVNDAWSGLMNLSADEAIGRTVRQVLPDAEQWWIDQVASVCDTGLPRTMVRRIGRLRRDYEAHAFQLDGDRFAIIFVEVTDRLQAERRLEALLTLGDRLREASSVAEMTFTAARIVGETLSATRAGFGRIDDVAETMAIERDWTDKGMASIEGVHRFADYGDLLPPLLSGDPLVIDDVRTDPRSAADPAPMLAIGIGALLNMPVRERGRTVAAFLVHDSEPRHWTREELDFLRNVADRVEVGVARLHGEERQRMLNGELSHRLKNTLAMVQAIAGQTLKRVTERDAVASFEQRLGALASAHDVLLGKGWEAADLATVAARVLEVLDGRDRFRIDGPPIELGSRAALSTSLLLHELGTNAVKYGALSVDAGSVAVTWVVNDGVLRLDWREAGGPPAEVPRSHGFGSRLINLGLVGTGGVTVRYEGTGFSATMFAPLTELQQA
ncbi:GAF domain-containing protein [Sphingomonas rubra]|uniref:histidine kinase n=1 Tax=Sphingomonas rubra TaxID=634430 RepID=A0A1I5SA66_9SPHN|nr:GAF domain-containing protein [Sphingomonas rubra]SFP67654.1 Two-component sensor histidine kinase, contains HisKA and HATPase domains [Sphingomonas rubra]